MKGCSGSKELAGLASTYECAQCYYAIEEDDRAVMAEGWQRALTSRGNPQRPGAGAKVRLVMRQDAVSDGVSEAGVTASVLAKVLERRFDVDVVTYADAETFDWSSLPDDGRFVILASTSRVRYGANAKATFKPHLHLALWNPYQALDFDAPALITYGFAAPALDAVDAWLSGTLEAKGHVPVPGFTSPSPQ